MRNVLQFVSILVMALALTACGGGDNSSSPGGPVAVVSTTPANGATKVDIHTAIVITLSGNVDSSSVNRATAFLSQAINGERHPVTVTYDNATGAITMNPSRVLWASTKWLVTLSGIKDKAGNTVATTRFLFSTERSPYTKRISYTASGIIDFCSSAFYDANDNITRSVYCYGAGADGTWFTPDDAVNGYSSSTYDDDGSRIRDVYYNGAGADGIWFTADDAVGSYSSNTYDADGNRIRYVYYVGAGADGTWFTADDAINEYSSYTYDADSNMTKFVDCRNPGADGVWFTADDVVNMFIYE